MLPHDALFVVHVMHSCVEYSPSDVEKASQYRRHLSRSQSSSTFGTGLGDDKSEISELFPSFSCCSEVTRPSDEGGIKPQPFKTNSPLRCAPECLVHTFTFAQLGCTWNFNLKFGKIRIFYVKLLICGLACFTVVHTMIHNNKGSWEICYGCMTGVYVMDMHSLSRHQSSV